MMTQTLSPTQLADVTRKIGELSTLRVRELRERLAQILGRPVRTSNRAYLIRKLSWHLRDQAEGHHVPRTLQELLDAGPALLPARWRERLSRATTPAADAVTGAVNPDRDARLPLPGTELVREFRGRTYRVVVHEADFEYDGRRWTSLSAIARHITGSPWNGMVFFGLARRSSR
ncbi:MAG: DUF2924 domain-containing protein [Deltaproteobacteria bacterium]|nr:DUF2924 domain-containing protein [Kofleriaceae bacterium]